VFSRIAYLATAPFSLCTPSHRIVRAPRTRWCTALLPSARYRFLSHAPGAERAGGVKASLDLALERFAARASASAAAEGAAATSGVEALAISATRPRVATLGSFSKFLGPGLRAGWIEASPPSLAKSLQGNGVLCSGGCIAQFSSCVIGCAMHHGLVTPHLVATRRKLARRGKVRWRCIRFGANHSPLVFRRCLTTSLSLALNFSHMHARTHARRCSTMR
jgi:hypothetical protein